jgi:uncharacterized protein
MSNLSVKALQRSKFNRIVPRESGGFILYNSMSGSLTGISQSVGDALIQGLDLSSCLAESDVESLKNAGFLHVGDDEVALISERFERAKGDLSSFALTILPTLACNFRCSYCYQNHDENKKLSGIALEDKIYDFFKLLAQQGAKQFSLTWYGGEPLLGLPMIERLTPRFASECDALAINFSGASIITNGSLMDSSTAKRLVAAGVRRAQISFDSYLFEDRLKRGMLNQDGSPSIILQNILSGKDIIRISIRINVTRENESDLDLMKQCLDDFGLTKQYYLARVHSESNGAGWDEEAFDHTIPVSKFSEMTALGDASEGDIREVMRSLVPKTHYCGATRLNMFTINNSGGVSRCWHSAESDAEQLFNLFEAQNIEELRRIMFKGPWSNYNPVQYDSCSQCHVLPLCMGGCSHGRNSGINPHAPCESIKYSIDHKLAFLGNNLEF